MNNYSIEVKNLTKKFGQFTAVDNISFKVKSGEIFGFLGANGAGKSTTIRMLCGILTPTSGDALIGNNSIISEPDNIKLNIGYMSQKFSLYDDLTVDENIQFFGGIYGLSNNTFKERRKLILEMANLKGKENLVTKSLPGGIKQRLALGTAVIHLPRIVFLDEPTSGVDPISRRNFWELINNLSSDGITVLVTTHYLEEAEYCNNIILIDAGKIIAEGSAEELKSYIKTDILEIECDNLIESLEILKKQNFVEETSIFGNFIHIIVNNKYQDEKQIKKILRDDNSIEIKRIEKIIPSLEDVFIHLVAKE
ncbi:MAG: ATP-binding cassette domain-containing protein, partial [Ignavibacteriales bacterium]|nr:ATP-binding cassette domain-containing protein [Ignavibacteriales bacterium]